MFTAIDRHLAPGGLVVFGELHGTMESPALVASAAEHAAKRGPVAVGLELPDELQLAIDRFLVSGDRLALRAAPSLFWTVRDGRGGAGLLALLDRLRALPDLSVCCFDGRFADADARDAGMAASLSSAIAAREAAWLVSCGSLHARTDAPHSMAWYLRARYPELIALNIAFDGGRAWVAERSSKGIKDFGAPTGDSRRGVVLFDTRDASGYDGAFHLGPVTPSMPL